MADLFHEDVPDEFIDQVFASMALTPRHRFLILTKRPERMRTYLIWERPDLVRQGAVQNQMDFRTHRDAWPLPNVWLGTSVEDQRSADERIPHLLATPAAVRFVSAEPLLGPVEVSSWLYRGHPVNTLLQSKRIDWLIVGGESGPRARPMDLAWARSLVAQCRAAGVPVFVKQLGAEAYDDVPVSESDIPDHPLLLRPAGTRRDEWPMRESHGRDPSEWPEDLRIREWPK